MRDADRHRFCLYGFIAVFVQFLASVGLAQSYPDKPVRIVVGFSPGGGVDTISRLIAPKLSSHLGQSVVVENRVGAAGSIAAEYVAKYRADGYTLLMLASSSFVNAVARTNLPYDLVRDFAPVSLVATGPLVLLVNPSSPVHDAKELVALARARPGKLNYGSDGLGGTNHLAGELFNFRAKVKLVHVPFRGATESVVALAGGQIEIAFSSLTSALPLLGGGKVRALAVTGAKRSSKLPSIPTLDESGLPGYDSGTWFGMLAPVAVPKDIIARLNEDIIKAVNTPEMKEAINKQAMEPQTNSPEQYAAFMRARAAEIAELVKLAGFKVD